MVKPGIAAKLEAFVTRGGTFVTTFFSGIVDENDLVYLGGYPGPLRKMLGIWAEEIDALTPTQSNSVVFSAPFGDLHGSYGCRLLCDRIHAEGADVLATYGSDFYAGEPAITVNSFGQGQAYYLATALDPDALTGFVQKLCDDKGIAPPVPNAPPGVEALPRVSPQGETMLYLLNHNAHAVTQPLPEGSYTNLLTSQTLSGEAALDAYGVLILARQAV